LRKISAKDPYMILEAFLLIQMGGSGIVSGSGSMNSCLFREDNQFIPIEANTPFQLREEENSSYLFTDHNISPDSIIKSDSNTIQKAGIVSKDSAVVAGLPASNRTSRKVIIEPELPNVEPANDPVSPEFILNSEEGSYRNYIQLNASNLMKQKKASKPAIYATNGTGKPLEKITPVLKNYRLEDWFTIILVSAIVLIAWVRSFFGRNFQQSIQSLYDYTLSARIFKNRNVLLPRISFLLLVNFVIMSSLFAFKSLEIINLAVFKASFANFLQLNLLFLGLICFRFITFHGLNILFPRNQSIMEYFYQVQNYYKSIGLIVIPILIFETYYPSENGKMFLWLGAGSIMILYLYRLIRGQRIVRRMNLRVSYLLLYILSFEILPISICYKIFAGII
jgi:hypothetical protein